MTVVALLEHVEKAAHQLRVLRRNSRLAVDCGMKIKEIEEGRLHGVYQQLAVKGM